MSTGRRGPTQSGELPTQIDLVVTSACTARAFIARLALALVLLFAPLAVRGEVEVLTSDDSAPYAEALAALGTQLAGIELRSRAAQADRPPRRAPPEVVVTLGAEALRTVLRGGEREAVVAMLVPRATFETIREEHKANASRRPLTAIYLDQAPVRQLALVRAVLGPAPRVAAITSDTSMISLPDLRRAARDLGVELVLESVASPSDLQSQLRRALAASEALLAVPDPQLYNAATLQQILLATFRMRQPVFGFSAGYVRAGALASVYSTPAQMAQQGAAAARRAIAGQSLPPPQHPQRFVVTVNRSVARSLNLTLDTDEAIAARVEQLERER